jgi:hypothetical protein
MSSGQAYDGDFKAALRRVAGQQLSFQASASGAAFGQSRIKIDNVMESVRMT